MSSIDNKPACSVLVIDDEVAIRELLEFDLKDKGYLTYTASNGVEGLEIISKLAIDLIITDLRMPDFGGVRILKEVRSRYKGAIPAVIVITGHFGLTVEEALALGACSILQKPFGRQEFIKSVQTALTPFVERWKSDSAQFISDTNIKIEIEDYSQVSSEGKLLFGWGGFSLHTPEGIPAVGQKLNFILEIKNQEKLRIEGWWRGVVAESRG